MEEIAKRFGKLDVLVNNGAMTASRLWAGVGSIGKGAQVNLTGPFLCTSMLPG
jgi:NAD(P)-dependent dehydrogenase (short-subunit alcohol dehydrogenase family)